MLNGELLVSYQFLQGFLVNKETYILAEQRFGHHFVLEIIHDVAGVIHL